MRMLPRSFAMFFGALAFFAVGCSTTSDAPSGGAASSGSTGSSGSAGSSGGAGSSGSTGSSGSAGSSGGSSGSVDAGHDAATTDGGGGDSGGQTSPSDASTGGGATLCTSIGWCEITNTKLAGVCPDPSPGGYCQNVMAAWGGGAADVERNVLYLWGGGHMDYAGNEVYGLDLSTLRLKRLNEPTPSALTTACSTKYADGLPASRHTYDGLTFLPTRNVLFAFGGSRSACGYMSDDTWWFSPATLTWQEKVASGPPAASPGVMTDTDAAGNVYLHDTGRLYKYDPGSNTYATVSEAVIDYHQTGRIDPVSSAFIAMGNGRARSIPLGAGSMANWDQQVSGCDALLAVVAPGLAFDTSQNKLVGWAGGGDVYVLDTATKTCTKRSYPGGPGPAQGNGTYGRFRYFPKLGVFVVVTDWQKNAFALRL